MRVTSRVGRGFPLIALGALLAACTSTGSSAHPLDLSADRVAFRQDVTGGGDASAAVKVTNPNRDWRLKSSDYLFTARDQAGATVGHYLGSVTLDPGQQSLVAAPTISVASSAVVKAVDFQLTSKHWERAGAAGARAAVSGVTVQNNNGDVVVSGDLSNSSGSSVTIDVTCIVKSSNGDFGGTVTMSTTISGNSTSPFQQSVVHSESHVSNAECTTTTRSTGPSGSPAAAEQSRDFSEKLQGLTTATLDLSYPAAKTTVVISPSVTTCTRPTWPIPAMRAWTPSSTGPSRPWGSP